MTTVEEGGEPAWAIEMGGEASSVREEYYSWVA